MVCSRESSYKILFHLFLKAAAAPIGDIRFLFRVSFFWSLSGAQLNHLYAPTYVSNPVARHVAFDVEINTPGVAQLSGYEQDGHGLEYYITSLPEVGRLYEVSQNYRSYGTEPKNAPTPIQAHQLPFLVTDQLYRVAYIPPANVFAPVGRWASFSYVVKDTTTNIVSEPGRCVLANGAGVIVGSAFTSGADGWTIEGNLQQTEPVHQPFAWGLLNRYIYATDEVNYVDFTTGVDRQSWYFVAPSSYSSQDMATAYGGTLTFNFKATYGDFDYLNTPPALNWIQLDCASCNDGLGLRVVRQVDSFFNFNGEERSVSLKIEAGQSWVRDPLNGALAFTPATECEIAATLNGLSKLKILGDFTKSGEGVALDDVLIVRSQQQPAFPVACQQGCACRHYPTKRMTCCGNTVQTVAVQNNNGGRRQLSSSAEDSSEEASFRSGVAGGIASFDQKGALRRDADVEGLKQYAREKMKSSETGGVQAVSSSDL